MRYAGACHLREIDETCVQSAVACVIRNEYRLRRHSCGDKAQSVYRLVIEVEKLMNE